MSTKAVIIALLVALVLGIGAYVALQPPAKSPTAPDLVPAGETVFPIDPGLVSSIEIETPDGAVQRITRGERGVYSLRTSRQSVEGPSWPLEDGRVSNLLRRIHAARSLDAPDPASTIDDDATRVTFRHENGATLHMLLNARTLTGRGLVKVIPGAENDHPDRAALRAAKGRLAIVEDDIHNVFRQPGPRAWRDTVVLPGMGPDVSRLSLRNNDLSMKLARVDGKWALQEPVAAPADPERVARLLGTLAALRITSFADETGAPLPAPENTGLAEPIAVIQSETDRRILNADPSAPPDNSVSVRTESAELIVGKPADLQAQSRYASQGKNAPVIVIAGNGLTRELFDPVQYITRRAVQTTPADIGMLVIEPAAPAVPAPAPATPPGTPPATPPAPVLPTKVFRRDIDKWKEVAATSEVVLDETLSKALQDLLRFLTTENAASVALEQPAIWKDMGQVVVGSASGTPLETITIGATDGANLGLRATGPKGAVYRWFPRDKVPALLLPLLPKPTETVPVSPETIKQDVVK
jgi:hypothetical protein